MMWTPPKISDKQLRDRHEFTHELEERIVRAEMTKVKGILDEFNYELRRIDSLLELVRAPADCGNTGMKPHYYHVIRWNQGAPPSFMVVEGEHGEFVEPTARLFERLKQSDLWDPANVRRLRERHSRAEAAAAKYKAQIKEEQADHLRELVNAALRTQVSMNTSVPWAQNAQGYNRIKGNKKKG